MVADTTVYQDRVVWGLYQIGLDAKHELTGLPVEIAPIGQPAAILLQQLRRQRRKELQRIEEGSFLFHDAVDRDIADFECRDGHGCVPQIGSECYRDGRCLPSHREMRNTCRERAEAGRRLHVWATLKARDR